MIRVAVHGAAGRMGKTLIRLLSEEGFLLAAAIESPSHPALGSDAGESAGIGRLSIPLSADPAAIEKADVVIDFSVPEATAALSRIIARAAKPAVVGTTGLSQSEIKSLEDAARRAPILYSPNMSIGVNLLTRLVIEAAKRLPDFDIEIFEAHHRFKADAPSGTAIKLARSAAEARGAKFDEVVRYSMILPDSKRKVGEINIQSARSGDIVGEHTVFLVGLGERLELTHRATSRDNFARGALKAAKWVVGKDPGLYDMGNVLGF